MAEVDVLVILAFGRGVIFFLLSDAGVNPMFASGIDGGNGLSLIAGPVFATAQKHGRFNIELGQSETGIDVLRIELCGALEFSTHLRGQSNGGHEICALRLFAVHAPQPQMKAAVVGIERGRFLAGKLSAIPVFKREVSAAEQVGGFGVGGSGRKTAIQFGDRIIDAASRKHVPGGVRDAGRCRCHEGDENKQNSGCMRNH